MEGLRGQQSFVRTIGDYNGAAHVQREEHSDVKLNPSVKDGLSTQSSKASLTLAKSNWALLVERSPYLAVRVTSGITFSLIRQTLSGMAALVYQGCLRQVRVLEAYFLRITHEVRRIDDGLVNETDMTNRQRIDSGCDLWERSRRYCR